MNQRRSSSSSVIIEKNARKSSQSSSPLLQSHSPPLPQSTSMVVVLRMALFSVWQISAKLLADERLAPMARFITNNLSLWHYEHQIPRREAIVGRRRLHFVTKNLSVYHLGDEAVATITGGTSAPPPGSTEEVFGATVRLKELAFFHDHVHTHASLFMETINRQFPTKLGSQWVVNIRPQTDSNIHVRVVEERNAALHHPVIRSCVETCWNALPKDHRGFVSYDTHRVVFFEWFKRIALDVVDQTLRMQMVAKDWELRADGRLSLDHERFSATMVCTMDVWCETNDVREFEEFSAFFLRIVHDSLRDGAAHTHGGDGGGGGGKGHDVGTSETLKEGRKEVQDLILRSMGRRNVALNSMEEISFRSPHKKFIHSSPSSKKKQEESEDNVEQASSGSFLRRDGSTVRRKSLRNLLNASPIGSTASSTSAPPSGNRSDAATFVTNSLVSFVVALSAQRVPPFDSVSSLDRRTILTMKLVQGEVSSLAQIVPSTLPPSVMLPPTPAVLLPHRKQMKRSGLQKDGSSQGTMRSRAASLISHLSNLQQNSGGAPKKIRATVKPDMEEVFLVNNDRQQQCSFSVSQRRTGSPLTFDESLEASEDDEVSSGSSSVSDASVEEALALVERHFSAKRSFFQEKKRQSIANTEALLQAASGIKIVAQKHTENAVNASSPPHPDDEDEDKTPDSVSSEDEEPPQRQYSLSDVIYRRSSFASSSSNEERKKQGASSPTFRSSLIQPKWQQPQRNKDSEENGATERTTAVRLHVEEGTVPENDASEDTSRAPTLRSRRHSRRQASFIASAPSEKEDSSVRMQRRSTIMAAAVASTDVEFEDKIAAYARDLAETVTLDQQDAQRNKYMYEDADAAIYCPVECLPIPKGLVKGLGLWKGPMHCSINNDMYSWHDPRLYGVVSVVSVSSRRRFANPFLFAFLFEPWLRDVLRASGERVLTITDDTTTNTAAGESQRSSSMTTTIPGTTAPDDMARPDKPLPLFRWFYEKNRTVCSNPTESMPPEDEEDDGDPRASTDLTDWMPFSDAHNEFLTRLWIEGVVAPRELPEQLDQLREVEAPIEVMKPALSRGFDYAPIRKGKPSQLKLCVDLATWRCGFLEQPRRQSVLFSASSSTLGVERQKIHAFSDEDVGKGHSFQNEAGATTSMHVKEGHRICACLTYVWEYSNPTKTDWLPFPLQRQTLLTQWLTSVKEADRSLVARMSAALQVPGYTPAASRAGRSSQRSKHSSGAQSSEAVDPLYTTSFSCHLEGLPRFLHHELSLADSARCMAMTSWIGAEHITLPIRYHSLFLNRTFSLAPLRLTEDWLPAPVLRRRFLESRLASGKTQQASFSLMPSPAASPMSNNNNSTTSHYQNKYLSIDVPMSLGKPSGVVSPRPIDPFQRDKPQAITLTRMLQEAASTTTQRIQCPASPFDSRATSLVNIADVVDSAAAAAMGPYSPTMGSVSSTTFVMDNSFRLPQRIPNSDLHQHEGNTQQEQQQEPQQQQPPCFQTVRNLIRDRTALTQTAEPSMRTAYTQQLAATAQHILDCKAERSDDPVRTRSPPQSIIHGNERLPSAGFKGRQWTMHSRRRTGGGMSTTLPQSKFSLATKGKAGLDAAVVEASFGLDLVDNASNASEMQQQHDNTSQQRRRAASALEHAGGGGGTTSVAHSSSGPYVTKMSPYCQTQMQLRASREPLNTTAVISPLSTASLRDDGGIKRPATAMSMDTTMSPAAASRPSSRLERLPPCARLAVSCGVVDLHKGKDIQQSVLRMLAATPEPLEDTTKAMAAGGGGPKAMVPHHKRSKKTTL